MELSKALLIMIILLELKIIRLQNSQERASLRIRFWIIWDTVDKIRGVSLIGVAPERARVTWVFLATHNP